MKVFQVSSPEPEAQSLCAYEFMNSCEPLCLREESHRKKHTFSNLCPSDKCSFRVKAHEFRHMHTHGHARRSKRSGCLSIVMGAKCARTHMYTHSRGEERKEQGGGKQTLVCATTIACNTPVQNCICLTNVSTAFGPGPGRVRSCPYLSTQQISVKFSKMYLPSQIRAQSELARSYRNQKFQCKAFTRLASQAEPGTERACTYMSDPIFSSDFPHFVKHLSAALRQNTRRMGICSIHTPFGRNDMHMSGGQYRSDVHFQMRRDAHSGSIL